MTEYTLESRILPDGQWTRNQRKLGTVYWSDASLHQVRNVGTTMSHTISVHTGTLMYFDMPNSSRLVAMPANSASALDGFAGHEPASSKQPRHRRPRLSTHSTPTRTTLLSARPSRTRSVPVAPPR